MNDRYNLQYRQHIHTYNIQLRQTIQFMIRYLHERQSDVSAPNLPALKQSHPISQSEIENSSNALKSLKRTDDHLDSLKRRLSVLQIHEEKQIGKMNSNERRWEFHSGVRDEMDRRKRRKQEFRRAMRDNLQQTQKSISKERRDHEERLRKARELLQKSKQHDYKTTKELSTELAQSRNQYISSERQQNLSRKEYVISREKEARENVSKYRANRKESIRQNQKTEGLRLKLRESQKKKMLEKLSELEGMMIQRESRSRASYQESEAKIRKFMLPPPLTASRNKHLPSVSTTELSHHDHEIVIL